MDLFWKKYVFFFIKIIYLSKRLKGFDDHFFLSIWIYLSSERKSDLTFYKFTTFVFFNYIRKDMDVKNMRHYTFLHVDTN